MSTPKVGQKVRCTLGDSVIVGRVTYIDQHPPNLRVEFDGPHQSHAWLTTGEGFWTVEVLPDPIPEWATHAIDRDGDLWSLDDEGSWLCDAALGDRINGADLIPKWGPLTFGRFVTSPPGPEVDPEPCGVGTYDENGVQVGPRYTHEAVARDAVESSWTRAVSYRPLHAGKAQP